MSYTIDTAQVQDRAFGFHLFNKCGNTNVTILTVSYCLSSTLHYFLLTCFDFVHFNTVHVLNYPSSVSYRKHFRLCHSFASPSAWTGIHTHRPFSHIFQLIRAKITTSLTSLCPYLIIPTCQRHGDQPPHQCVHTHIQLALLNQLSDDSQ